jgi:hypothetical protein
MLFLVLVKCLATAEHWVLWPYICDVFCYSNGDQTAGLTSLHFVTSPGGLVNAGLFVFSWSEAGYFVERFMDGVDPVHQL